MDDCTEKAFCNGRNATCPNPDPKPDNVTECNQGTQVCTLQIYLIHPSILCWFATLKFIYDEEATKI